MTSPETSSEPPNRNTTIAEASERQHQLNMRRRLHDAYGIEERLQSGIGHFALEDILQPLEDTDRKTE